MMSRKIWKASVYAVLSNCFVRSTNIGCDSIGLFSKINDLPPTWNFTIAGFVAICDMQKLKSLQMFDAESNENRNFSERCYSEKSLFNAVIELYWRAGYV